MSAYLVRSSKSLYIEITMTQIDAYKAYTKLLAKTKQKEIVCNCCFFNTTTTGNRVQAIISILLCIRAPLTQNEARVITIYSIWCLYIYIYTFTESRARSATLCCVWGRMTPILIYKTFRKTRKKYVKFACWVFFENPK